MFNNLHMIVFLGVGNVSIWEFSGYEPYFFLYDLFIRDNCLRVIVFRADVPVETQAAQVSFWLHFLKARLCDPNSGKTNEKKKLKEGETRMR